MTIDDTSSLISYSGNNTWRPSSVACATCLEPGANLVYAGTWHDGTHIVPTLDGDDFGAAPTSAAAPSATSQPAAGQGGDDDEAAGDDDDDDKGDDDDKKSGKGKGKGGKRRRGLQGFRSAAKLKRQDTAVSNPFFVPSLDSDDPGFVDKSVTVQFNFTGSAIYLFAIVPEYAAPANTTPTYMNLTFTFDSQPAGTFRNLGKPSTPISTFTPSVVVFQRTGLPTSPHSLTVSVGPDSVFLLDYIVYTAESDFEQVVNNTSSALPTPANSTIPAGAAQSSPSPSVSGTTTTHVDSSHSSHNVATFAGAIGGSVGLLTVLAVSLAFSIYRRRLRARRRDRAYREARGASSISSFHTDASEDGPPMQGPEPFVPRYFPGTVITAAPPPYSRPASPSNDQTSALLGPPETPMASMSWSSRRTGGVISDSDSYADRPPPTPPNNGSVVGFDEDGYYIAPPPFPVAIAAPVPAILAGLSGVASPSPAPTISRPTTPVTPVIPLLPPPPPSSSRPASVHSTHEESPGAGPSGRQIPRAPTPPAQPVASARVSVRSLSVHTSEDSATSADCETNAISRRSPEPNWVGATAPVLISPGSSITDSQGGTGAQERGHRSEGEADAARR
ncbi:hypothetical protein PHLGIDRAFT_128722 [Phlebiopsis gigantea 11061_1 CR5-6]|uniref:Uncharacterized protein n=1 Tax=Phlebiopsis gigantea (strain 11061_1 CR5-6) TaxID=745531 RepID=A0A0C3S5M5_PHLG1|nr:hypothetical protein PHLGIDRAFT_128722 [Phlebiopsis gigantea 11061_1 CR5-6]